ncbi:hypothetical protein GW17_00037686 [Ensete ventricosum]|nr:hypothetical protein GW17_00037686 [Ensete ventricosum]
MDVAHLPNNDKFPHPPQPPWSAGLMDSGPPHAAAWRILIPFHTPNGFPSWLKYSHSGSLLSLFATFLTASRSVIFLT